MKKLNQNGFTAFELTLLVLVLAALGFSGYMVWQNNKSSGNNDNSVITQNDTVKKDQLVPVDPTKDWQSYTSPDKKFSVKFPQNWETAANQEFCSEGLVLIGVKMPGSQSSVGKCASDGASAFGQMAITTRTDRTDLSLCGHSTDGSWSVGAMEDITVAGFKAVKSSATYTSDDEDMGGYPKGTTSVQYCFVANNVQYIASYTKFSDYPDVLTDFNTMVTKTFKLN